MKNSSPVQPHIRQCSNPDCAFRFPVTEFDKNFEMCPKCHSKTDHITLIPKIEIQPNDPLPEIRLSFILDNLRSVFNVGSIFRSSDGCGIVDHLYLCGTTPTPDHPKMAKTALGAENQISWSYHKNGLNLVQNLIQSNNQLVALELTKTSIPLWDFISIAKHPHYVFIVGNEVTGTDPEILQAVTNHVHLPMHGIKESLNVAIAASILAYSFH